jgi:hypothetical protein
MRDVRRRRRAALAASQLRSPLALAALLLACSGPAFGLVTLADGGSGNTTPPPDDPGFANVGVTGNGLTAVYLGNGWVLTARHVGAQGVTLAGSFYPFQAGSWTVIEHAPGVPADLALERIVGTPPLPSLLIAASPISVGEDLTMIGNGWARQPTVTCWDEAWSEVSCGAPPPEYRGYKRLVGAPPGPRWGRNLVHMTGIDVPINGTITRSFEASFDLPGLPEEAQAVVGDSGGGAFVKRGAQWQLAGILFAIDVFDGQPAYTAVFGDHTYAVDLTHYREQIVSIVAPAEVPGLPWPGAACAAGLLAAVARRALPRATRRSRGRAAARDSSDR